MQAGASEYCSATAQARERPSPGPALGFIRTWTLGVTVTPDGQVRLLDYGIAQTADRAGAARAGLLILDQPGRASSCCLGVPRSAHTRCRLKLGVIGVIGVTGVTAPLSSCSAVATALYRCC